MYWLSTRVQWYGRVGSRGLEQAASTVSFPLHRAPPLLFVKYGKSSLVREETSVLYTARGNLMLVALT